MPATTGATGEEKAVGTEGKTGKDDNRDRSGGATAGMVGEHSECVGVPAASLMVGSAALRTEALVTTGEATAGALPNLGREDSRVGAPIGFDAKLPVASVAGSLVRAETTFVLMGNTAGPRLGVPVIRTGGVALAASNDGLMAGVRATKGQFTAGGPGILAGDWGKTGARTTTWPGP